MQLRRHSAVPLYRQMEAALLERIDRGELRPGERLPTETELAAQWKVNRLTVRQAIGELARAGRVVVGRGTGTFVAEPALVVEVDLPSLPTTEAEASGSELMNADGRHVTEVVTAVGPDDSRHAAAQLGVPRDDLVRIDTVISESGTPWIASRHWVPASRFPGITDASAWEPPVYRMLREHYGVRLRYAWRTIESTSATAADAEVLDVPPGSAVMVREGMNVDDNNVPTLLLSRRMRGDRIKYVLRYDISRP